MRYSISYQGADPAIYHELQQISAAIENLYGWYIPIAYSTPDKPQKGQMVYAESAQWDPGAGTGVYFFDGSAWVKVGAAAGGSGATQLNELTDVGTVAYTNRHVLIADGANYDSRLLVEADISDLGVYLTDAPADGNEYVRINNTWGIASGGGGGGIADEGQLYFFAD